MNQLKTYLEGLDPEQAMNEIGELVKGLLPHVSQRARLEFIYALTGDADSETLPGLVHL